jgi:RimJ/RimL family protein N-acetyltransferase
VPGATGWRAPRDTIAAVSAVELATARLLLRPWRPDDGAAMAAINSDPEVARMLNRPVHPQGHDGFVDRARRHWEEYGFGWYAVEGRHEDLEGQLVGFTGVTYPTFLPELAARPEIGWRLAPRAWGRGLATEAARAAAQDAFTRVGLPELISIIHPDNVRSQRVATKLGMAIERQVENPVRGDRVQVWTLARLT